MFTSAVQNDVERLGPFLQLRPAKPGLCVTHLAPLLREAGSPLFGTKQKVETR